MNRIKDLTGRRFGRLTVIGMSRERSKGKSKRVLWICRCDCGKTTIVSGTNLTSGDTNSCGCYATEIRSRVGSSEANLQKLRDYQDKYTYKGTRVDIIRSSRLSKDNTTGHKGVYYDKRRKKYFSSICLRGKTKFLGYTNTIEESIRNRRLAEEEYFKPIIEEYNRMKGIERK